MAPDAAPRARSSIFERKAFDAAVADTETAGFKRSLGPFDLTSLGVAAIIGAGIFVFLGQTARDTAGPAAVVSLVVSGVAAIFAALAYAELASMLPGSGSAYTYAYAALGRLPAFMMGWLILNAYAVGNMTVAIAWTEYAGKGLGQLGLALPTSLTTPPPDGGIMNLPAALIMALVTLLCLPKIRESTRLNNALVVLKVGIVLFIIVLGMTLIRPANYVPFSPGGVSGIVTGSAVLFFAYLGFDVVSATAEESRNPRRDLPIGIIASVVISMVLYILMSLVVTGMEPSAQLDEDAPLASAFDHRGYAWAGTVITVGAIVALLTVLYAFQVALARIMHAMARDRFLPPAFARLHATTATPWALNLVTGGIAVLGAGFLRFDEVGEMAVEASIAVYVLVGLGVLALKWLEPTRPRRFQVPWPVHAVGIVLLVGIAGFGLQVLTHLFFAMWVALGLIAFGFYAHARGERPQTPGL